MIHTHQILASPFIENTWDIENIMTSTGNSEKTVKENYINKDPRYDNSTYDQLSIMTYIIDEKYFTEPYKKVYKEYYTTKNYFLSVTDKELINKIYNPAVPNPNLNAPLGLYQNLSFSLNRSFIPFQQKSLKSNSIFNIYNLIIFLSTCLLIYIIFLLN